MGKIKEIVIGADYQVTVRFDNNHSITIDMNTKLHHQKIKTQSKQEV